MFVNASQPLLSAIMLTCDRPLYAERAIRSFLAQTWQNKELVILDTGDMPIPLQQIPGLYFIHHPGGTSIGDLRNRAIERASGKTILHWDDDDVSHPRRMEDQFSLLCASDADIVGYSSLYFQRVARKEFWLYAGDPGEACGTSMMYRRKTWENRKFRPINLGEDGEFQFKRHVITSSGVAPAMMLASHHGGNISKESARFIPSSRYNDSCWALVEDKPTILELSNLATL